MAGEFRAAIKNNAFAFGIDLSGETMGRLAAFYTLVLEQNPLLHLVAPCSPEEFAVRHILESLTLLEHLPPNARFTDIGAGAGLPSIPCLIVRSDLRAVLIESKEKKSRFLAHAVEDIGLAGRVEIINRQFEEVDPGNTELVTCRAIDRFAERVPRIKKWAGKRRMALFGGPKLAAALKAAGIIFEEQLLPLSEQRFLFVETIERRQPTQRTSRPYSRSRR